MSNASPEVLARFNEAFSEVIANPESPVQPVNAVTSISEEEADALLMSLPASLFPFSEDTQLYINPKLEEEFGLVPSEENMANVKVMAYLYANQYLKELKNANDAEEEIARKIQTATAETTEPLTPETE